MIDIHVLQEARMALQPIYDELGIQGIPTVVSKEVFEDKSKQFLMRTSRLYHSHLDYQAKTYCIV